MIPIIKIKNLSVIYDLGKTSEAVAVRDVNIDIYPGEYVIFYGPSGCGKSTLLYSLAGLETPTRGEIFIKGNPLSAFNSQEMVNHRRSTIGMIFQAYHLIPTLSVLDNVLLPDILGDFQEKESIKKGRFLLEKFGIVNLAHRYPGELSGGQQQRVAIARSLIHWPPILFADEPVGNLDSESAKIVINFLSKLNKEDGKTMILVTHDPSFLNYAHRVFHMKDGRIIREVVNSERKPIAPVKERMVSSEIETLARTYPHLSEAQIKAKALAQFLLTSLDGLEVRRLEDFIKKRISGEVDETRFREMLDKPFKEGGVGLYRQTAQDFVQKVEKILAEANFLQQKFPPSGRLLAEIDFKVADLRKYLLDGSTISFKKEEELQRLDHFIRLRLEKRINGKKFQKFLDLSFKKGGVGLNARTAKNFTKRLELALIKY